MPITGKDIITYSLVGGLLFTLFSAMLTVLLWCALAPDWLGRVLTKPVITTVGALGVFFVVSCAVFAALGVWRSPIL